MKRGFHWAIVIPGNVFSHLHMSKSAGYVTLAYYDDAKDSLGICDVTLAYYDDAKFAGY